MAIYGYYTIDSDLIKDKSDSPYMNSKRLGKKLHREIAVLLDVSLLIFIVNEIIIDLTGSLGINILSIDSHVTE